jgi:hypothetical protein
VTADSSWRYRDRIIIIVVLTSLIMNSTIIRDVTPCNLVDIKRFGGTNYLNLHGQRFSQAIHKQEASRKYDSLAIVSVIINRFRSIVRLEIF